MFPYPITPHTAQQAIRDALRPLYVGLFALCEDEETQTRFLTAGKVLTTDETETAGKVLTKEGNRLLEELVDLSGTWIPMLRDLFRRGDPWTGEPPEGRVDERLPSEDWRAVSDTLEVLSDVHVILRGSSWQDSDGWPEGGVWPGLHRALRDVRARYDEAWGRREEVTHG